MSAVAQKLDDIQTDLERTGAAFTTEKMLAVRDVTRAAIHEIATRCKPGMVEEDAVEMAKEILASHGMVQGWHDVYVRFGTNTTKTFGAPSDPGIVLGEGRSFPDRYRSGVGEMGRRWWRHLCHRLKPRLRQMRRRRPHAFSSGPQEVGKGKGDG